MCVDDNFVIDYHFNQVLGEVETEKAVIAISRVISCFLTLFIFYPNLKKVWDRPYQMCCLDLNHFYRQS